MVNITVFGPWSGKKVSTMDKAGVVEVGAGGLDSYDTEAHLLPIENNGFRWNRRGKFSCLAMIADICAFLALLLIVISTGFLLWKVWWVKTEVDKMQPAVMSLSASLTRLRVETDALHSENNALISAYTSQTGNFGGSGGIFDEDSDNLMEDTNVDTLTAFANQQLLPGRLDGSQTGMVGMRIYVAVGEPKSESDKTNLTKELKNLFKEASDMEAAAGGDAEEDSLPQIFPILDAGDNHIPTTNDPAVVDSADEDDVTKQLLLAWSKQLVGLDEDEDDDESDLPETKDLDSEDSDDEDLVRSHKWPAFKEAQDSDSD